MKTKHLLALSIVNLLGKIERLLYKKQSKKDISDGLSHEGYSFAKDSLVDSLDPEVEKQEVSNKYFAQNILSKKSINKLAEDILANDEVREKLSTFFGGAFRIGFITYYKTSTLPSELKEKSVYANHWHFDTLLTDNCVKLMILPNSITSKQGPLQIFSKNDSKDLQTKGFLRGKEIPENLMKDLSPITFLGENSRALFVRSHVCLHTAGVPEEGHSREQIMIQFNPAKKWSYHTDLYEKQFGREPTLALLKNLSRPKKQLDL